MNMEKFKRIASESLEVIEFISLSVTKIMILLLQNREGDILTSSMMIYLSSLRDL